MNHVLNVPLEPTSTNKPVNVNVFKTANAKLQDLNILDSLIAVVDARRRIVDREKFKVVKLVNVSALIGECAQNIKPGMENFACVLVQTRKNGVQRVKPSMKPPASVCVSLKSAIKAKFSMKNNVSVFVLKRNAPRTFG